MPSRGAKLTGVIAVVLIVAGMLAVTALATAGIVALARRLPQGNADQVGTYLLIALLALVGLAGAAGIGCTAFALLRS